MTPIRQMNTQYGITTGVASSISFQRSTVTCGSISRAGTATATVIAASRKVSQIRIVENLRRAEAGPSSSSVWEISGIRAVPSAPSPRIRRNRFGRRNAEDHALMTSPPPRIWAERISRNNPRIRLRNITKEYPIVLLNMPLPGAILFTPYTEKRTNTESPSCTIYSLPSMRSFPAVLAAFQFPYFIRSS